jgi:nitrogen fixation protein FixH
MRGSIALAPGRTVVTLERGGEKAGARNLTVYARFEHPTVSHADRVVTLDPVGDDMWRGAIDLPAGVWDFIIDIRADGEKKFRSRERIEVRDTKLQVNG